MKKVRKKLTLIQLYLWCVDNLIYDKDKGEIYRLYKGKCKLISSKNKHGYITLQINRYFYYAHRIIFMLEHQYIPDFIDHKNGVRDDNRIENLREATREQNCYNARKSKNPRLTSKYKGVSLNKAAGKWIASIKYQGKYIYLGIFDTEEEAYEVWIVKAKELHGEFFCEG